MVMMKDIIKKFTVTDKDYRLQAIMGEIAPLFSDRFETTYKVNVLLTKDDKRLPYVNLETQNGEPIKFHKDFDGYGKNKTEHKGDLDFEVNGMKADMVFTIERTGYLENSLNLYRVIVVTDKYVYSEMLSTGGVIIHSHNEIKKFKEMDALVVKSS